MALSPRLLKGSAFTPRSISGLALWLDASSADTLYTTDAGPVTAVSSPTEISGCVGWWDASDAASITQSVGLVSQWNDKSTAGNHATASSTARPTTGTRSLNGKNVLDFDGTANAMATSLADAATQTVLFVAVSDVASGGRVWSYGTTNRGVFSDSGTWAFWRQQTSGPISFGATASATSPSVACALFTSNSSLTTFGNGAQGTTNDPVDSSGATFNIGKESTSFHNGYIAEIVIYDTALSTADRARVEAYLAQRWGISGVHAPATATSDPVGYWADKSGNARHATQGTAGSRPVIHSATQNNRKILSFDGSNDALLGTGAQALKTGMTVIGAYFSGAVNYSSLFAVGDSAAGKRWISGSSLGKIGIDYYTNSASVSASASNRTGITSFTFNPSANSLGIRMDGAQVLSEASLSPALAAYTSDTFAVGTTPLANEQFFTGRVFELAVYNRVLSAAECRRVEQALATKWGLTLAPQVSNADAQDWINRVYANGGTVSASTAAAVNTLCESLDASGVRPLIYRMGIFAGSNINAALVPLYRGPSLGGTQYGNTTDTNNAFVGVGTDYAETGATSGLTGNGTTKSLNTGFLANTLTASDMHIGCGLKAAETAITGFRSLIGAFTGGNEISMYARPNGRKTFAYGGIGSELAGDSVDPTATGDLIAAFPTVYRNGVATGSNASSSVNYPSAHSFLVFAIAQNGTTPINHTNARINWYSIGKTMTATQAATMTAIIQAFQASMSRT